MFNTTNLNQKISNKTHTATKSSNSLFTNNVLHHGLILNIITPINRVENIINTVSKRNNPKPVLPVAPEYIVKIIKAYLTAWFTQNRTGGISMIITYVIAGLIIQQALCISAAASGFNLCLISNKTRQNLPLNDNAGSIGYFEPPNSDQSVLAKNTATSFSTFKGDNSLTKGYQLPKSTHDAGLVVRNPEFANLIKSSYDKTSLAEISKILAAKKTVQLNRYEGGGHSAVTIVDKPSLESAIGGLLILQWDRDNIMQALAEYQAKFNSNLKDFNIGEDAWKKGLSSSLKYQMKHQFRIIDVIDGKTSVSDINARPHIRYIGVGLEDINDPWGNAQNDALSSINYLLFHAMNENHLNIEDPLIAPYANNYAVLLPNYFKTVRVWEDWDFGAWEDKRAEHASSIGMALACLREQKTYVDKHGSLSYITKGKTYSVNSNDLNDLITKCENKLKTLLPDEFTKSDDNSIRHVDAALVNPLYLSALSHRALLDDSMNSTIINNIQNQLMGDIGIRRYPGDVWDGRVNRNELPPSMSAQWTHVSPMISVILADMYARTKNPELLKGQIFHFNRALAAIDADRKIPEAYIRDKDNTKWIADDNKPLAWSQASLIAALIAMHQSIGP